MARIRFQLKLSVVFISLVCSVLTATTFFIYQRAIAEQKKQLQNKILALAKLSAMLIDADKHSQIKPEKESENTPAYKEIEAILKNIRNSDAVIDSVYTMVKTDKENIWAFMVDSGDRRKRIDVYCSEAYDVSRFPQMRLAFDAPVVDKDLTVDSWGSWLSSYAPIYNKKGEAVAIVALDIYADSITQMQLSLAKRFLLILVIGIIFSLFMGWFMARGITRPLRALIIGVRAIEKGDLNNKVKIQTKDELGDLANAFNKMTSGLLEAQVKLQQNYLDTIKSLAKALEAKDNYTKGHSDRVTNYAVGIAYKLSLPEKEIELLREICVLHDVGKIGIPEDILNKKEPLTKEDWQVIRKHPEIGESILRPIEFLRLGLSIVSDHHERWDGAGYPKGLKKDEISILAAIVAVADAYDAMTSDRPYRKAMTKEKAISILNENKNIQFNAKVVDTFVEYLKENA